MNIIDANINLAPGMIKLFHCNGCDRTWAGRKKPKVCPHCGAKTNKVITATEDQCEAFIAEYSEALAEGHDEMEEEMLEEERDENKMMEEEQCLEQPEASTVEQTGIDTFEDVSEDTSSEYEPIGFNPDSYAEEMVKSEKLQASEIKSLLSQADQTIRETKWALRRAGLPSDHLQSIKQDIASRGKNLGVNIPAYTEMMMKLAVDTALQQELRHPRKGRVYDTNDVNRMLSELDINEDYYESYYEVAGLR